MALVSSLLVYSFVTAYQGGGKIQIQNLDNKPVTLTSLSFVSNAVISGDPYGNLFAWGASLSNKQNPDGVTYTYTISEPTAGVVIPAKGSAELNYGYTTAGGPLNVGMNPVSVAVATKENPVLLPVKNAGHCVGNACQDPLNGKILAGYYTDWDQYAREYNAEKIPVKKINHILYAFIGYDEKGNISLLDPNSDGKQLPAISQLRQQYPYLHASLSFGGWTLSKSFAEMTADPQSLQNFITNAIAAMKETGFDGIDIDWEYPNEPQDAANFANFMTQLRAALDVQGKKDKSKYYLTIAAPAGIDQIEQIKQNDPAAWQAVQKGVDRVNLMTYDYHGAWDKFSDHNAPMKTDPNDPNASDPRMKQYNIEDTVKAYLDLGFEPKQLVLGIPAYWRTVNVSSSQNSGLYQPVTGAPKGQYNDGSGVYDYGCVLFGECFSGTSMPADMQYKMDTYSNGEYGYSLSSQLFASGDNIASVSNKISYVNQEQLGGVMFWTFSGDVRDSDNKNSLINTAWMGLISSKK